GHPYLMHFGLDGYVSYMLYGAAIAAFLLSVFWRPIVGIFYVVPLIPLQTIRYRTNDLPLGESLLGIVLLGVGLGLLRRHQSILPKSPWTTLMAVYAVFTYVSLCLGSDYLGLAFPFPGELRFSGWREYMMMPVMLLVIIAVQPTKRQMQAIVLALCF